MCKLFAQYSNLKTVVHLWLVIIGDYHNVELWDESTYGKVIIAPMALSRKLFPKSYRLLEDPFFIKLYSQKTVAPQDTKTKDTFKLVLKLAYMFKINKAYTPTVKW